MQRNTLRCTSGHPYIFITWIYLPALMWILCIALIKIVPGATYIKWLCTCLVLLVFLKRCAINLWCCFDSKAMSLGRPVIEIHMISSNSLRFVPNYKLVNDQTFYYRLLFKQKQIAPILKVYFAQPSVP